MEQPTYRILLCSPSSSHSLPTVLHGLKNAVEVAQECLARAPKLELAAIYSRATGAHMCNVWPEKEGE